MAKYQIVKSRRNKLKWLGWGLICIVALLIVGLLIGRQIYNDALGPVSRDQRPVVITIEPGSSVKQIAAQLASQHLIKNAWAFEWYVHGKPSASKLLAGTYAIAPSAGTPQVIKLLTNGSVATRLVTILPGRRIDQVRADFINSGFTPVSVDKALNADQYADLAVLTLKPATVSSLEGLLWPDSYQKDPTTDPVTIVRSALIATASHLTPDIQSGITTRGLSLYQGVILASVIEQEVSKPSDRAQAAQVFFTRLQANMMLGSDVTAQYGSLLAGRGSDLTYDTPYNTLIHTGLPPSPISSISEGSLTAAAHPAATNWVYFVAGDDGTTYFSKTLAEHQALTSKYCHKLCGR